MADFAADIKAFCAAALAKFNGVVVDVTTDVATSLVEKTPVDTGAARANWQFGAGAAATGTLSSTDQGGIATISALAEAAKSAGSGGVTFITNNLPYMEVLEYGMYPNPPKIKTGKTENGFSTQAPDGMRDITVLEVPAYVQRAVAK